METSPEAGPPGPSPPFPPVPSKEEALSVEKRLIEMDKDLGDSCATRGAHGAALLHYDAVLKHRVELFPDIELAVLANRSRSCGHELKWEAQASDAQRALFASRLRRARLGLPKVAVKAALRLAEACEALDRPRDARFALVEARYYGVKADDAALERERRRLEKRLWDRGTSSGAALVRLVEERDVPVRRPSFLPGRRCGPRVDESVRVL